MGYVVDFIGLAAIVGTCIAIWRIAFKAPEERMPVPPHPKTPENPPVPPAKTEEPKKV